MTTHLHPVDLLPITDTPICDTRLARFELNDNFGHVHALPEPIASILERRARKAEAQLAVAVAAIRYSLEEYISSNSEEYDVLNKALAEINAIGGGE